MANKLADMVEDPKAHPGVDTARTMPDAASSNETLGGYAAVNAVSDEANESAIARLAYEIYQRRQTAGTAGSAESDWQEAESQLRSTEKKQKS